MSQLTQYLAKHSGMKAPVDRPSYAVPGAAELAEEAVTFKVVPEYKEVAAGSTAVKVVIALTATAEVIKPANVALMAILDKSSSMVGSKMELVRGTVDFLAEQLSARDALGLAKRDLPLLNMMPAAKTLAKAVNAGIKASGCTALMDGLTMGLKEHNTDAAAALAGAAAAGGVQRRVRSVFLCTDGLPNCGPTDAHSIVSAMRAQLSGLAAADEPVSIHTFGFGADHDARLLQAIAEAGHGIYYFIQDDSQIPEAFGDALGGLLSVVACGVRITITPLAADGSSVGEAGCSITRVQHGGSQETPGDAAGSHTVKFADLFAEERREVLLQLNVAAAAQEGHQAMVKARDPLVAATAARFQVAESEANRFAEAEQHLLQARAEVESAEALGGARQAYVSQLADMTRHIQAVRFASIQERSMASTRMTSCSNAMSRQRAAGVGYTSAALPASYAAAPAPRGRAAPPPAANSAAARRGAAPAHLACMAAVMAAAGARAAASAAAPGSTQAEYQQQQRQEEEMAAPWASNNSMRKKMAMSASGYVSGRSQTKLSHNMDIVRSLTYNNELYHDSDADMMLVNALQQAAAASAGAAAGTPGSSNSTLRGLAALQNLSSLKLKVDGGASDLQGPPQNNCFQPLVLPLQQLTNVTRLGVNWLQRRWAEDLPVQLQLHVVIDAEFRLDDSFSLAHCTGLTKLSSNWTLNLYGDESLPCSLRVLQVGSVDDADALLQMTPSLRYLSMRQCSTEAAELRKLTALTSLQELHLEYGMDPATSGFDGDSWQSADDDDSYINVSAAAWGELPMLRSLRLRCQERAGNDGPISAAAVKQLGCAVGITSLVVNSCWLDAAPAELAAALTQLTRLRRLRLADLKWAPPAAATAGAAEGGLTAEGAQVVSSGSNSSSSGSGSGGINTDSDTDDEEDSSKAASGSIPSASLACVLAAAAQLPQLVHLELDRLPLQSRQALRQLASASAVTHLSISRCGLRVAGVRALAPCIVRLRALLLDGNPQQLSMNDAGLNAMMLVRALVGQGLRDEAKQSLFSNLGLSAGKVQMIMEAGAELTKLQATAASWLLGNMGLDADAVLLLQAMLESRE
ncbi:hypothetical protein COO60DRAFT_1658259 [Scenedesmus sp. NREL 46B-D3]|nr:hypothetical protein COO60DRAFT_1658259 [Scenedesmus sp. NREL 46B-D3]